MAVWSEVRLSRVSPDGRLEAEFYQPKFLELEKQLEALLCCSLESVSYSVNSGPFGSNLLKENYVDDGVVVVRPFNIKEGTVEQNNLVFLSAESCAEQKLHFYKPGDLVFARVGDIACGILPDFGGRLITISPNIIVVRVNAEKIEPRFLALFMNTRLGLLQMERAMKVVAQPTITVEAIKGISIPALGAAFERQAALLFEQISSKKAESQCVYAKAEATLLDALGIDLPGLAQEVAYERSFSDIARYGRFDAQYYHPEKLRVLEQLSSLDGEAISTYFTTVDEVLVPPEMDTGERVQNYDLTDALRFFLDDILDMPTVDLGSNKLRFRKGDVVVSRLRSYLREIALVETGGNCVGSTEFIVLRPRESQTVSAELLLVYLRAEPVQRILKWCQGGSQHPRFRDDELTSIRIPSRLLRVQDKIVTLVRAALNAYQESKQLLDEAKARVEEMILAGPTSVVTATAPSVNSRARRHSK